MRIQPSPTSNESRSCNANQPSKCYHDLFIGVGIFYILSSLTISFWYVLVLNPAFANDLWWREYNASGHQGLLVDLFNQMLVTTSLTNTTIDILAPSAVSRKHYSSPVSTTNIYASYARRMALYELTTIEFAVRNLRTVSGFRSMYMPTQYCWVDLKREYEVAHTIERQKRCYDSYATNGAVYYETVLRNQVWTNYIQNYGGKRGQFTQGIQLWLEQFPSGRQWLEITSTARETTSIYDEILYWKSCNLSSFTLQWQNFWRTGIAESLGIANSLNFQQNIDLKSLAQTDEIWSSVIMYWLPFNDFAVLGGRNVSLIRAANNSFIAASFDVEWFLGLYDDSGQYTNQVQLFRTVVGPFNSIDMRFLAAPIEMQLLYDEILKFLFNTVSQDWLAKLDGQSSLMVLPTPPAWMKPTYTFHGGSPLCLFNPSTSYVQQPFGFADSCTRFHRLSTTFLPYGTVLALLATHYYDINEICSITFASDACKKHLESFIENTQNLQSTVPVALWQHIKDTKSALIKLNVSLIQFVTENTTWKLVHQPLLDDTTPEWSVFGWLIIYEWTLGMREVVVFEGDVSFLSLISTVEIPEVMHTSRMKITTATRVVGYAVVYVSVILGVVGFTCLSVLLFNHGHMVGINLFWFNRIVGSSWIGRSLLLLRGITAIVLLSSPHLEMVQTNQLARFKQSRRQWAEVCLLSGETIWLVYVWNEILTIVTQQSTAKYAPLSSSLAWIATIAIELITPVSPTMNYSRECSVNNMADVVICSVGVLHLGTTTRVVVLLSCQILAIILAWILTSRYKPRINQAAPDSHPYLGMANVLVDFIQTDHLEVSLDTVSCTMAGHVPFRWQGIRYTFDVKLWVVSIDSLSPKRDKDFSRLRGPSYLSRGKASTHNPVQITRSVLLGKWGGVVGAMYAAGALAGSISYLRVTSTNLKNDMFWANFNMTGTHSFLASWWNLQLILHSSTGALRLDEAHINYDGAFDKILGATIQSSAAYGTRFQHMKLSDLISAINGLRVSDPALVPWIHTQYCYVDFSRRWELANTAIRQERCQEFTKNGAIYLESVLTNTDFPQFYNVWGEGYEVGIASTLRESQEGGEWLEKVASNVKLPVEDEATRWKNFSITHFDTQWQNYKHIGLVNSYRIVNMLGVSYSLTLQYQNWTFRHLKQTTNKMYWGLANDFHAILSNTTRISGHSLVRSSSKYAFQNTSIESVLYENNTLVTPLMNSFEIVRSVLGPFGSIDLQYVACPQPLVDAVRSIIHAIRRAMSRNITAQQAYFSINDPSGAMAPVPKSWSDLNFIAVGGSPLCPAYRYSSSFPVTVSLVTLLSWATTCSGESIWAVTIPTRQDLVIATILAGSTEATTQTIASICAQNFQYVDQCKTYLKQANSFVQQYLALDIGYLSAMSFKASNAVRATQVGLFQFGRAKDDPTAPVVLYRLNLLNESEYEFQFFSWKFLLDWAVGNRGAISFKGDQGEFTLITEFQRPLAQPVNLAETPNGFATYMQSTVYYVTIVMIFLAFMTIIYVCLSNGHIEVLNLLELQRVGAIVWIGRPLLLIRSITALGVLSTSSIELEYTGYITQFIRTKDPWYKTLLAVNEVTWLVAIVNDVAMVYTREYTSKYATLNSFIVWLAAARLGLFIPIQNTIRISPICQMTQVDFQVACQSGQVQIGNVDRFIELVITIFIWNFVCYFIARFISIHPPSTRITSVFVYAGARYLYMTSKWISKDIYYMDRMSAALNGIITFRWNHVIYCLDIKLWYSFKVDISSPIVTSDKEFAKRASYALPLQL